MTRKNRFDIIFGVTFFLIEFRAAFIQLLVGANKQENIKRAVEFIQTAAKNNAKVVALPVS